MITWTNLYPDWFVSEQQIIARRYPQFEIDKVRLSRGRVLYYGELVVRPSGGAHRHPIVFQYPEGTPFEPPVVVPVESTPELDDPSQPVKLPIPKFFDHRHQMPGGALCLFQRETRGAEGGEATPINEVLERAEAWFMGHHTGRWPPDTRESELEHHFDYAGDVLLSKTFYSSELNTSGSFYMARDMPRFFDGVREEMPPLIVTAITCRSGGVEVSMNAREELQHIYPWLSNDAWSIEESVGTEASPQTGVFHELMRERGRWWSLGEEPRPFRNGAGLLRELEKANPEGGVWQAVSGSFGADLTLRETLFVGLRYPKRKGGVEWLVLVVRGHLKSGDRGVILSDAQKRHNFEQASVACFHAHGVQTEELQLRNLHVVSSDICNKKVALIGLGSLGGKVAELLAQAGVGDFSLCDVDRMRTGNSSRHIGGVTDFGARKSSVVMSRLWNVNPGIRISAVKDDSAVRSLDKLADFIKVADVVICTTADENVETTVNHLAVLDGKTVIYGRALRRGSMGRVFLVRPGIDPCKSCLGAFAHASQNGAATPDGWCSVAEPDDEPVLHECGRPVIPASAVDLSFVAATVARTALDYLEDRQQPKNHWIWSRKGDPDVHARLAEPLSTYVTQLPRRGSCHVCGEAAIVGIVMPSAVRKSIVDEVETCLTVETGGILIGYVDNAKRVVITRATGPGPNATKTAALFNRDVAHVQTEPNRATEELGPKGLYVGEWHSHLEADPNPSARDIESLYGIAESANYATSCPAMVIAGLDPSTAQVAALKAWVFPAGGRIRPVEIAESA